MGKWRKEKKNQGFTLVELLVVLVILSILAAICVPALMGYIDKSRINKNLRNGHAFYEAAQAKFAEQYGKNGNVPEGTPVVSGASVTSDGENKDQDITGTAFAEDILDLVGFTGDNAPYCLLIGVGSNAANTSTKAPRTTKHDKYTVLYVFYMQSKDSTGVYFYNGEWTTKNPRYNNKSDIVDADNVIKTGIHRGKRIQYYLISNRTGMGSIGKNSKLWTWLKNMQ